jgi:isoleucyl-tRNA synthetase
VVTLSTDFNNDFWQQVLAVKNEVNRCIELTRKDGKIKGSLQAEVTLYVNSDLFTLLSKLEDELRFVLITSVAKVIQSNDVPEDAVVTEVLGLTVLVSVSSAQKCSRCWHHREDIGHHAAHPELCERCVDNVEGEGEKRAYA